MSTELLNFLWDLALTQRWFSPRDGRPANVELGDWLDGPDGQRLRPAVLVVAFPDGHDERYLIPLLYRNGAEMPIDACDDGGVLLHLLSTSAPGFEPLREVPGDLPARRYQGEQSNTSIFFGTQIMGKVFRRLEPGINVDVELHRALAGSGVAADLYGTWTVAGTDYAVFLEALPEPTDGYDMATEFARDHRDFTSHARALGAALAEVHRVLADRLPVASLAGVELAAEFRRRFEDVARQVPAVDLHRPVVEAIFDRVAGESLTAQRVHGDCHLGQVLFTGGRWVYVDFEGEPMKSLAERRLPDSPLRDVAGMLRSFDYAAATQEAPTGWRDDCRAAFLRGYGIDPAQPGVELLAYEADKAGYEALYESRYRPHLLRVPLDFLSALEGATTWRTTSSAD